ncbi:MAG: sigma-70 family RNA polymerase sigma factor [Flammeovirgaceae bacterium]|nr:sigma-70 family RNA polymerase sigma factor [Flammeovirgaceae bacterium]
MIYAVCLKYLKNRDDAKDTAMSLFEKLTEVLKMQEISNFKSWLYVTTRNQCLMRIRSGKGKKSEEFDDTYVENQVFMHQPEEDQMETNLIKLERCIEELKDEQKECVRLFYLQEKCYNDISELTGFSFSNVKSYIQNGKRNLKNCMERNE